MAQQNVISRDREILGGTPVFVGTRVPVRTLLDYLEGDQSLQEFLDDFPTVQRDQVITVLEQLKHILPFANPGYLQFLVQQPEREQNTERNAAD